MLINPWEHTTAWKTESQFYTWLRGQMRKMWKDNPVRIDFKKSQLRPVTPEEKVKKVFHPSTKNVAPCYQCGTVLPGSRLEVDHLAQAGGCKSFEEAIEFLKAQVYCPPKNMGLICKPCHKIKSYAEKHKISFEDAKKEKCAIAFSKLELHKQKEILRVRKLYGGNQKDRRQAYRDYLEGLTEKGINVIMDTLIA